jgi:acyl-CoA thioesterase FadM
MTLAAGRRGVVRCRPRYEGCNIGTWIGFRNLVLLVEEAVLQWFRDGGVGPGRLYHEHGLGLEVIDSSVQLPALLEVDDEVEAEVVEDRPGRFTVTLRVARDGAGAAVLRGRVAVALVREAGSSPGGTLPADLSRLVVADLSEATGGLDPGHLTLGPGEDVEAALRREVPGALVWSWRAPYFACHFSDRVQHSAFVRALEDVVDRFLAERGLSIGRLLAERAWIPVVSRARVQLVAAAHMEETVHTVFAVGEVLKRSAYDARMDCYVRRGDVLVRCATARILHGYARARGEGAGGLVELDDATIAALTGTSSR